MQCGLIKGWHSRPPEPRIVQGPWPPASLVEELAQSCVTLGTVPEGPRQAPWKRKSRSVLFKMNFRFLPR